MRPARADRSARFGRQAEAAAQTTQRVQQAMRSLQAGGWEGRGAAAFFGELDRSVLPSMQRLSGALAQSQTVTRQVSQVMRAAEEEASRPFRGQGSALVEEGGGFWGAVGDFFTGAWAELKDMVTGLWNMVTDPVGAAKGLWYGVTHPGELWDALKQPYVEAWENGRPWEAIGRGTVAIFTTVLGTKGADKIAKALKGATLADDAARLAALTDDAGRVASLADDAGRLQQVMGNHYTRYMKEAEVFRAGNPRLANVPTEHLAALRAYTGSEFYADLNRALRTGNIDDLQRLNPMIQNINRGLDQMPRFDGPVYRGTSLTPEQAARYVPGEFVTESAFTSTSAQASKAFSGNTRFVIQSSTGRDISSLSVYGSTEAEVLFRAGNSVFASSPDLTTPLRAKTSSYWSRCHDQR
ncbi:MAG: WXG100 family type VII secretion target [Anaerolineae bacterium]